MRNGIRRRPGRGAGVHVKGVVWTFPLFSLWKKPKRFTIPSPGARGSDCRVCPLPTCPSASWKDSFTVRVPMVVVVCLLDVVKVNSQERVFWNAISALRRTWPPSGTPKTHRATMMTGSEDDDRWPGNTCQRIASTQSPNISKTQEVKNRESINRTTQALELGLKKRPGP